jgi:hypothetical protein
VFKPKLLLSETIEHEVMGAAIRFLQDPSQRDINVGHGS